MHLDYMILVYLALTTERASTVAMVHASDVLFSFVLEYVFYGIIPNNLTIVGAAVILSSVLGLGFKNLLMIRKGQTD